MKWFDRTILAKQPNAFSLEKSEREKPEVKKKVKIKFKLERHKKRSISIVEGEGELSEFSLWNSENTINPIAVSQSEGMKRNIPGLSFYV